jgi:hypothetical protein
MRRSLVSELPPHLARVATTLAPIFGFDVLANLQDSGDPAASGRGGESRAGLTLPPTTAVRTG